MNTVRTYGDPPFRAAVIHGGPGAPGYMAPVARELAGSCGILEPLQGADTLAGQIEELHRQLTSFTGDPFILIGSSWGAVLALFYAAKYGRKIRHVVMIGSAVFDSESSARITDIRLSRLSDADRRRYRDIVENIERAHPAAQDKLLAELGSILDRSDFFDPIDHRDETITVQYEVNRRVWYEFTALRDRPGFLATEFSSITNPVTVIHGTHDPHPLEGIEPFLRSCLNNVDFHVLPACGHYPWLEKQAREAFYDILREIMGL